MDRCTVPRQENILCVYQNVRGLRSKTSETLMNACNMDAPILCLSETWLSHDIQDSELLLNLFSVYRSDRNFIASGKSRGGGVLFARQEYLKCRQISLSTYNFPSETDIVCVRTTCMIPKITFIVVYVPADASQKIYDEFIDSLSLLCMKIDGQEMIVGDSNIPHLDYPSNGR